MALTVDQMMAVSFPKVVAEKAGGANQWEESAVLRAFSKMGFIKADTLGDNIEVPLDYQANPDTGILVSDQDTSALIKTEVFTSAVYEIAQLRVPITWTEYDEIRNPTDAQKINLVKGLIENGLRSHDNQVETNIFTSSTAGGPVELSGLNDLISTAGTGTVGGIDASVETWWANIADTFVDATDMEAAMTEVYNDCAKGSGSDLAPTLLISGSDFHALFESQLQSLQRYTDSKDADAGFKTLAFKGARYIFSHKGGTKMYFLNPRSYFLQTARNGFRTKGETHPVPGQSASYVLMTSYLQFCVANRSRLGVLTQS